MGCIAGGSLFIALFGLGTLPMLLGIALAGGMMTQALRRKLARTVPIAVILMGLLFILRGLALGIQFLSSSDEPMEEHQHAMEAGCCE